MRKWGVIIFLLSHLSTIGQDEAWSQVEKLVINGEFAFAVSSADSLLEENLSDYARAKILFQKGEAQYYLNQMKAAGDSYTLASFYAERAEIIDPVFISTCLGNAAWCWGYLHQTRKQLETLNKSVIYAERSGDSTELAAIYSNLGSAHTRAGNTSEALAFLTKAYEMDIALRDTSALSSDLNNLAYLFGIIGHDHKAIDYLKESLSMLDMVNTDRSPIEISRSRAVRMNNLGARYRNIEVFDSAIYWFENAIDIYLDIGDSIKANQSRLNMSGVYNDREEYHKAIQIQRDVVKFLENRKVGTSYAARNALAESYIAIGNTSEALQILEKNLEVARTRKVEDVDLMETLALKQDLLEKAGRYYESLQVSKAYLQMKDSFFTTENQRQIAELEVFYDIEKKETELELLTIKNQLAGEKILRDRREKTALYTGIGFILLLASYVFYVQRKQYLLKNEMLANEMDGLRSKINLLISGKEEQLSIDIDHVNEKLIEPLTEREMEILQLAITDMNNRAIAEKVFLSIHTVKFHLRRVYDKLGVSNRKEALVFLLDKESN